MKKDALKQPGGTLKKKRWTRDDTELTLLGLPAAIWFLLFCYLPMFGLIIAFKDYRIQPGKSFLYSLLHSDWVGFSNFNFFLSSKQFPMLLRNTIVYNLVFIVLGIVLPVGLAMMISQIYSKTLYASQDVRTPVKTSMISLAVAAIIYVAAFPFVGYLAIPVGIVISGYLKNYLLGRACRRRSLIHTDARTVRAILAFFALAIIMGAGLWFVPITNIWILFIAIGAYGIIYLPIAYMIDRKI